MSFEPTKEQLIDFVYGTLSEAERIQLEQAMKQNPDLKAEIEALNQSRSFLGNLEDQEVLEPERFMWELTQRQQKNRSFWPVIAVAASLSLLLIVAYATKFHISYGSFELAFGNSTKEIPAQLTSDQVQQMINQSITTNNVGLVAQIEDAREDIKSDFQAQLAANNKLQLKDMKRIAANYKQLPDDKVEAYLAQLSETNRTMINDFFTASAAKQQEYVSTILTDFYAFVDKQRKEDLQAIQANFNDLEYKNRLQTQQTDQILASIITTVNNGSMGQ
ncbi:MAG: hypothetical protein KDC79_11435 [Cyclobacteriaceae bacterium]|nr:hypothetical protein [Cyclobacteriaceae bacterium]